MIKKFSTYDSLFKYLSVAVKNDLSNCFLNESNEEFIVDERSYLLRRFNLDADEAKKYTYDNTFESNMSQDEFNVLLHNNLKSKSADGISVNIDLNSYYNRSLKDSLRNIRDELKDKVISDKTILNIRNIFQKSLTFCADDLDLLLTSKLTFDSIIKCSQKRTFCIGCFKANYLRAHGITAIYAPTDNVTHALLVSTNLIGSGVKMFSDVGTLEGLVKSNSINVFDTLSIPRKIKNKKQSPVKFLIDDVSNNIIYNRTKELFVFSKDYNTDSFVITNIHDYDDTNINNEIFKVFKYGVYYKGNKFHIFKH